MARQSRRSNRTRCGRCWPTWRWKLIGRTGARRLQQAIMLYRGSLLEQFFLRDSAVFEEWALLKREQLHRRALQALAQQAAYHERCGEHALAEHATRRLLELDPWREASQR